MDSKTTRIQMRQSLGVGTPRGLQGRICALMLLILSAPPERGGRAFHPPYTS